MKKIVALIAIAGVAGMVNAQLINEFEPNPVGTDPGTVNFEMLGTPGAAFDGWVISVETDTGTSTGIVDRAANVVGVFDLNGILSVTMPDLENPSFSLFLSDAWTGTVGTTNIATGGYGPLGNIFDSINIADTAGDEANELVTAVGGTSMAAIGTIEPERTWRDRLSGAWYSNTFEGIVYDEFAADVLLANPGSFFDSDPIAYNFGSPNQALIPAPASLALLGMGGLAMRRRR